MFKDVQSISLKQTSNIQKKKWANVQIQTQALVVIALRRSGPRAGFGMTQPRCHLHSTVKGSTVERLQDLVQTFVNVTSDGDLYMKSYQALADTNDHDDGSDVHDNNDAGDDAGAHAGDDADTAQELA